MIVENVRKLCKERGMSISSLERAAKLGNGTISRWSDSSPRVDSLLSVAKCLGVTLDALLETSIQDRRKHEELLESRHGRRDSH